MSEPRTYLPTYYTNLIGRAAERVAVAALLQDPASRLVTLVGDSGAGKTRLALEVAAAEATAFPGGVVFVPLAPVLNPDLVLSTIAHQLGIQEQPQEPLEQTLISQLAERPVLLVLDNFEQILAAGAGLQRILDATSAPKIMVTSQQPLDVPAEQVYQVPPLQVPNSPADELDLATLALTPAVQLFVDRMRQVQPQFKLTAHNAAAVLEICRLVRGFPLAIELVAAHSATFSPNDLVLFLRSHLTVRPFRRSMSGSSSREDILGPVLDWCYARLNPAAQQLFQRLGVFLGGWTDEAAAAVCALDGNTFAVEKQLALLVEKHLVQEETLPGRERRYLLLDAVREYTQQAAAKTAEWEQVQAQHAQYYSALATRFEKEFNTSAQEVLPVVEGDIHNLRAAMGWYVATGDTLAAIEMYGALFRFWLVRGYFTEVRTQLRPLLESLEPDAGGASAAKAWNVLGVMAAVQMDVPAALRAYEASLRLYESLGQLPGQAALHNNMALLAAESGNIALAEERYQRSLEISRQIEDPYKAQIWNPINNLGNIAMQRADYALAVAYYDEAIAICETLNLREVLVIFLNNRANAEREQGLYDSAKAYYERALTLSEELGYVMYNFNIRLQMATNDLYHLHVVDADRIARQALKVAEQAGNEAWVMFCEGLRLQIASARGDTMTPEPFIGLAEALTGHAEHVDAAMMRVMAAHRLLEAAQPQVARAQLLQAMTTFTRYEAWLWLARCLEVWAATLAADGDFDAAARMAATPTAARQRRGIPVLPAEQPLLERLEATLAAALPPERRAELQAEGASQSVLQVIQSLLAAEEAQ